MPTTLSQQRRSSVFKEACFDLWDPDRAQSQQERGYATIIDGTRNTADDTHDATHPSFLDAVMCGFAHQT